MIWYVLSSGLDLDKPPKLTTQRVIALIIDDTIGKNAQIMQANGGTGKWELIRHNPEFAETFASLRQLRSQEKALAQERRQEETAAVREQQREESAAAQEQRQEELAAAQEQRQEEEWMLGVKKYPKLEKYLTSLRATTHLLFWLFLILDVLAHISVILRSYSVIHREWEPESIDSGLLQSMQQTATINLTLAVISMVVSIFLLMIFRMCLLATLEFVQVVIDIEKVATDIEKKTR